VTCLSAAVRRVLLVWNVEWVNGPDAGLADDALKAALALLEIRPLR
jgi:hypothetical protein